MLLLSPLFLVLLFIVVTPVQSSFSNDRKLHLRSLIRETWDHAYSNYMEHAFPADELRPLSCSPLGPLNPHNQEINDVMGNYSLTLIDSFDSFIVFNEPAAFENAIQSVIKHVSFDQDAKIQVFEVTIRVMGGLLTGHLHASSPDSHFHLPWYNDELLHLASDLADRLLPAFLASPTGIPFARINLRHGLAKDEKVDTCAAGAGSLLLEFATLSRLTNNPIYENLAKKAFLAIWVRRSNLDLVGNTIDVNSGNWIFGISSIGAGIDSLYEYMLKAYVLLGDDEYLSMWEKASAAVKSHLLTQDGFSHISSNMFTGAYYSDTVDSLSSFWPGLLVLDGDIDSAIKIHSLFSNLWLRYSAIPETYSVRKRIAESLSWPLRPEFIESTLYLYRATKDEYYLRLGERIIHDIVQNTRVQCGLAILKDIKTGELEDRMHSFVLSETLKYLYLLFDEENPINKDYSNSVFSTEGHLLFLPNSLRRPSTSKSPLHKPTAKPKPKSLLSSLSSTMRNNNNIQTVKNRFCPAYLSNSTNKYPMPLHYSITSRNDFEWSRVLSGHTCNFITNNNNKTDISISTTTTATTKVSDCEQFHPSYAYGTCLVPSQEDNVFELRFAPSSKNTNDDNNDDYINDYNSQADQVVFSQEGKMHVNSLAGLTIELKSQSKANIQDNYHDGNTDDDGPLRGYVITKVGDYIVDPVKNPYILISDLNVRSTSTMISEEQNDGQESSSSPSPSPSSPSSTPTIIEQKRPVGLRFRWDRRGAHGSFAAPATRSHFGPDIISVLGQVTSDSEHVHMIRIQKLDKTNQYGCEPYQLSLPALFDRINHHKDQTVMFTPEFREFFGTGRIAHDLLSRDDEFIVVVERGECTFTHKMLLAAQAGAKAIIVSSSNNDFFSPVADEAFLSSSLSTNSIPLLVVQNVTGAVLETALTKYSRVYVYLEDTGGGLDSDHVVINGLRLLNAKVAHHP